MVYAMLTLSSCGIYTNYHQAEEVPAGLYGEEVQVDESASVAELSWKELFTDPTLQALIEQGLQNNTDLQSAQLRVEQAGAALLSAKLAYLPSFALAPQGTVSSFDKHEAVETYQLPVAASWQLDIFGGIRNAKKQAKAVYAQSQDYRQAVQTGVICGIANMYYTLRMLDEQLSISQETERSWQETVDAMRAMMNAGMANEAAVAQLEAAHLGVKASVLDLKEQINQVENSLSLLLAETLHHYERGKLADQVITHDLSVGIPMQLLANRPDVRAAEKSIDAAASLVGATVADWLPKFFVTGQIGGASEDFKQIFQKDKMYWQVAPAIKWNIFSGTALSGQIQEAKAKTEMAVNSYNNVVLNALQEVDNAMVGYKHSITEEDAYAVAHEQAQLTFDLALDLFKKGLIEFQNVLDAQRNLLSYEEAKVLAEANVSLSLVQLYLALGGGY